MLDVDLERRLQVEQPRHAVDQRQHVHREVRLHRRVLVELVQHDLRVGVALELDRRAASCRPPTRCARRGCPRSCGR